MPRTTMPRAINPPPSAIAAFSMVSVIAMSPHEVSEFRVSLHELGPFEDAVEAVVPAGADDQHRHEQQQPHEVGVDEAVAEPGVADPKQGHEYDPAHGGQS